MDNMNRGKNLNEYGHAIAAAPTLEEARALFIEMVEQFDFKSKKDTFIREARAFTGHRRKFGLWSWNIILSDMGLAVLKV